MSNKRVKFLIIFLVILLSILGVMQITKKIAVESTKKNAIQLMTEDEKSSLNLYRLGNYEVVSRDASGNIASYRLINIREEAPISQEFMTEAEKTERGLPSVAKIQVLERDSAGKISAYKVIYQDSDIIKKY